ncbi:MAG: glycosyltransferase [Moorea sp. SIOASIH]|uniref:glycosyltransferase n=1 Tax=Moorena sp. SIOASIH TaxID=2607817 RepID=UPI0013BA148A|nr:glycosyltransferase [Moorena sp. SIOASIH]NEO36545.1 glycosyltransferase [Moorena sp. SIOASIH]
MRILSLHNRYQIRGGEDECHEAEVRLLQEMGHLVDVYEQDNQRVAELGHLKMAVKTVWSQEAHQTVKQQLKQHSYDVIHIHNFLPLISPSVYHAAKAEGVRVVQTLHNYRLLCPNGLFFRDGEVCEDCLGKSVPLPGILHSCYRNSFAATGVVSAMLSVHHTLQTWSDMVDTYIALTEFARQKFIAGGLPANKIVVKPNFVYPDPGIGEGDGNFALYVGRLSVEKGLDTLLSAWEHLDSKIPLKIVGDGPLASQVQQAAQRLPQVEWLGRKPMAEVHELLGKAMCLVFPSKWYETFGRVAIEAFAKGTPVIAANIGAIAELVESSRVGLHFRPGDPFDLASKVDWLVSHPTELAQMRREARSEYEAKYTATKNYQQLLDIYSSSESGEVARPGFAGVGSRE